MLGDLMPKNENEMPRAQQVVLLSGFEEPGFEEKIERTGRKIRATRRVAPTDYTSDDPHGLAAMRATPEYKAEYRRYMKKLAGNSDLKIARDQRLEFAFSGTLGVQEDVGAGEWGRAVEAAHISDDPEKLARREALEEEARKRGLLGRRGD